MAVDDSIRLDPLESSGGFHFPYIIFHFRHLSFPNRLALASNERPQTGK
jgi:hypothetical protein